MREKRGIKNFGKSLLLGALALSIVATSGGFLGYGTNKAYAASKSDGSASGNEILYSYSKDANNNPTGPQKFGKIYVEDQNDDWPTEYDYIYYYNDDYKTTTLEGLNYNKKTNTLTLNGFNHGTKNIIIYNMGSDFKIKINGDNNKLQLLYIQNCGVVFKGSGKLVVNKKRRLRDRAILIWSYINHVGYPVVFSKKVKIKAFAKRHNHPLQIATCKLPLKKAVICKGGTMTECDWDYEHEYKFGIVKGEFVKK